MSVSSVWQCFSVHGEREKCEGSQGSSTDIISWLCMWVLSQSFLPNIVSELQWWPWTRTGVLRHRWPSLLSCSHRAQCSQFSSSHWSAQDLLHQLMLMTFCVSFYENYPLTSPTLAPWSDTIVVVSVMHQWVCDIEANNVNREQFQQHPTVGHSHASHILIRILILFSFAENRQWDRYY